jgi:outer membrane receptor protein involved in Fe transport
MTTKLNNIKQTLTALTVIAVLFIAASLAFGQGIVTGSISGTVLDPQHAVVAGAPVRATQVETNRVFTTVSSTAGVVQLPSLPAGTYNVVVEVKGFSSFKAEGVVVVVGKDTALPPIDLQVGNAEETVTVEGTAPLVESTTDQLSETFDTKQVESVPLGNTYDSFVLFSPGVSTAGSGGFSNNNGAELSINGQRARSNNFQLDGQNNNDNTIGGPSIFFGNQDVIAELQVVTNYDAEYGRNMGGVINYITKGGTNEFHGTGFEFWQGDHFDSLQNQEKSPLLGFCFPGQSASTGCTTPVVPFFVQNQFGGTVGGPIKKDKIWFFGSGNFERVRTSGAPFSSTGSLTPDTTGLQQLQAAFPNSPGVAALAQFGPTSVALGSPAFSNITNVPVTVGATTVPIEMGTLTRFLSQPFNDYETTGRVDFQLTNKDRFFTRYIFQQTLQSGEAFIGPAAAAAGQVVDVGGRNQQIGLDLTHTFSSQFLNQTRFSYSRSLSDFQGGGFPNCVLATLGLCPPQINIQDPTALSFGQFDVFPQGRIINVYQLQDNASMVHGRHVMKFGGEYDKQRSPNYALFGTNAVIQFANFSSLVADTSNLTQVAYGQPVTRFKENDFGLYFQDDWRFKDNLTLNLGLRWDFYQQASNLLHNLSVAQQTGPNPLWSTTLPLSETTVPSLPNHYHNFGPVLGFAWTPRILEPLFGNGQTVIRGGFRIAYDFAYYNLATNVEGSAPYTNFATIPTANAGVPDIATLNGSTIAAALFPYAPKGNPGVATELQFGNNFRNPYSQQWNLGIQRQIGSKVAAEARYVGSHSLANFQEVNGNPDILPLVNAGFGNLIPAGLTPCTNAALPGAQGTDTAGNAVGYANCNLSRTIEYSNTAFSIYNGLQTQLRLQNWHGFTGEAGYTYSRTIDNASEAFSSNAGTFFAIAQNPFNVNSAERGQSNYNLPNVFSLLWVYDLPFRHNQSGLLGHVLGGWQINGTYRYSSGQPYTVEQTAQPGSLCDPTDFTGGGLDACRPILNSTSAPYNSVGLCNSATATDCGLTSVNTGAPIALNQAHWIINNPVAATYFGSPFLGVSRNSERGQPINTVNTSIYKNLRLTERLTMQFQADAFNLFNHQWLGIPSQNVSFAANTTNGVNQFGTTAFNDNGGDTFAGNIVTDGIGRRRLQFGAKIIF